MPYLQRHSEHKTAIEHGRGVECGKLAKRSCASRIGSAEDSERFKQLQGVEFRGFAEEHNAYQQLEEHGFFQVVNDYDGHRGR